MGWRVGRACRRRVSHCRRARARVLPPPVLSHAAASLIGDHTSTSPIALRPLRSHCRLSDPPPPPPPQFPHFFEFAAPAYSFVRWGAALGSDAPQMVVVDSNADFDRNPNKKRGTSWVNTV